MKYNQTPGVAILRSPLTDDRIDELWEALEYKAPIYLARAVEREHGAMADQRTPLSSEQLREIARSMDPAHTEWLRRDWPCVKLFARAVEQAHGIRWPAGVPEGETQQQENLK